MKRLFCCYNKILSICSTLRWSSFPHFLNLSLPGKEWYSMCRKKGKKKPSILCSEQGRGLVYWKRKRPLQFAFQVREGSVVVLYHFIQFISHKSQAFQNRRFVTLVTAILGNWQKHFLIQKFASKSPFLILNNCKK